MNRKLFKLIGLYFCLLFVLSVEAMLPVSISNAVAAVYDDFNGQSIDPILWASDEGPNIIFSQYGGLLNAGSPPNSTYDHLRSTHTFRGDVEFVLDWRDFQSTATAFAGNCSQIWLQIDDPSGSGFIFIFRGLCRDGQTFFSNGTIDGSWQTGFSAPASSPSGLLKISRTGSIVTTFYNEGSGWVTLGTFPGFFQGDVVVQIAVYTGDNGAFHVSSDSIAYEGQMITPNPQEDPRTGCATFDPSTNILHIPCFNAGSPPTYWLDLAIQSSNSLMLQVSNFGENPIAIDNNQATFNLFNMALHIPCFDVGSLPTYWLDLGLVPEGSMILFNVNNFGQN